MSDVRVLPGLKGPIQFGYNALRGNFAGEAVFVLSFDEGEIVEYGPDGAKEEYAIPDGVGIDLGTSTYKSSTTDLLETTSDYDSYFSSSVSGSMSYMSYSASVNSSLAFRGSLFQQKSTYYAADFGMNKVYYAQRNVIGALEPTFEAALAGLPLACTTTDEREAYFKFFDLYGTHYFKRGSFGCYYAMQTEIESTLVEESQQTEITGSIDAAFNEVTTSGSMSVDVASTNSSFLSNNQESFSFEFFTYGGDGSSAEGDISKFYTSAYGNPIMLMNLTNLPPAVASPLSDLIAPADDHAAREKAFTDALQAYIEAATEGDGLLGTQEELSVNVQHTAAHDGFLVGNVTRDDDTDGDRATLVLVADPTSTATTYPTTSRAGLSMHYYSKDDHHVFVSSLTTPIRKGDKWCANYSVGSKKPIVNFAFQPLSITNGAAFGEWKSAPIGSAQTATTGGMLVAMISCTQDGARGYIQGYQTMGGGLAQCAAASGHYYKDHDEWIKYNSFCMPVPAGSAYQVKLVASHGSPTATAFWLPIEGDLGLIEAPISDNGNVKQAETDGILLGMINAPDDGDRGSLKVYVADSEEDIEGDNYKKLLPTMATSIHWYKDDDRWVPYNSVCVPIPRGMFYRAVTKSTSGTIASRLTWFPLVQTPSTSEE
ncbi:MAG: hypothetical protein HOW73_02995 [Polyangiaceae bacterium]|nr:hypothetical protein [Polyangiaceae bacterium]